MTSELLNKLKINAIFNAKKILIIQRNIALL